MGCRCLTRSSHWWATRYFAHYVVAGVGYRAPDVDHQLSVWRRKRNSRDPDRTPWALAHGHNPFFSNVIFAGQGGANMLTNTTDRRLTAFLSSHMALRPYCHVQCCRDTCSGGLGMVLLSSLSSVLSLRPRPDRRGRSLWFLAHYRDVGTGGPSRSDLAHLPPIGVFDPLRPICDSTL